MTHMCVYLGRMKRTVICADCGTEAPARNKLAKYCDLCRLVRGLKFIGQKSLKCWACERDFAPRARNDVLCGECELTPGYSVTGACALCEATDRDLLNKDIAVCMGCSTDPAQRPVFLRALIKKQARRRAGSA